MVSRARGRPFAGAIRTCSPIPWRPHEAAGHQGDHFQRRGRADNGCSAGGRAALLRVRADRHAVLRALHQFGRLLAGARRGCPHRRRPAVEPRRQRRGRAGEPERGPPQGCAGPDRSQREPAARLRLAAPRGGTERRRKLPLAAACRQGQVGGVPQLLGAAAGQLRVPSRRRAAGHPRRRSLRPVAGRLRGPHGLAPGPPRRRHLARHHRRENRTVPRRTRVVHLPARALGEARARGRAEYAQAGGRHPARLGRRCARHRAHRHDVPLQAGRRRVRRVGRCVLRGGGCLDHGLGTEGHASCR